MLITIVPPRNAAAAYNDSSAAEHVNILAWKDRPMTQLSFGTLQRSGGQREHIENSILLSLVRIRNRVAV